MGSYGRNFDFRVMPQGGERGARYMLSTASDRPIGAPVSYSSGVDTSAYGDGVLGVVLASAGAAPAGNGLSGILVYEHAPAAFAGNDPFLTTYSDIDTAPAGKLCQVVHGTTVKVVLKNSEARTFLHTRDYAAFTMVAGLGGATPTVEVAELLSPGTGNDTDGYWAVEGTAADGWLRVTAVDNDTATLEAVMIF